ncbi:hypothetical protein F5Y03DRAFT_343877 [Xylaria venustula]|nr:hypothetical protein F5Y03DRAFT_343877 [Xylaria venustula]
MGCFGFTIQQVEGFRIPALFPPPAHPIMSAQDYYPAPPSHFAFQAPIQAPKYPMMSPDQRSVVSQAPTAHGLNQGRDNAIDAVVPVGLVKDEDGDENNEEGDEIVDEEEQQPDGQQVKIKRPPNPWILFRQEHHVAARLQNPGVHNSVLCKHTVSPPVRYI